MKVTLEWITSDHMDRVAEISAFQAASGGMRSRLISTRAERFASFLNGEGSPFDYARGVVAVDANQAGYPLGYMVFGASKPKPAVNVPGAMFITDLVVDAPYKRRGIGRLLLTGLIQQATLRDASHVWTVVPELSVDLQCLLKAIGTDCQLEVTPGSKFETIRADAATRTRLSMMGAESRYVFHFPPTAATKLVTQVSPRKRRVRR